MDLFHSLWIVAPCFMGLSPLIHGLFRVMLGVGTERLRTRTVLGSLEMKLVGLGLTSGFSLVRFNRGRGKISGFDF